jgi:hypothetical protein
MKSKLLSTLGGCALIASSAASFAGWNGNTAHSRGNCLSFNESVTWNWQAYHNWEVRSIHFPTAGKGIAHSVTDWMKYTWRSAAFDNRDMFQGFWKVQGYHFYMDSYGQKIYDAYTESVDCSMYDGWWDRNKLTQAKTNLRKSK